AVEFAFFFLSWVVTLEQGDAAPCQACYRATTRDRPYYATQPPVKPNHPWHWGGAMTLHCTFYLIRLNSPQAACIGYLKSYLGFYQILPASWSWHYYDYE